MKFLTDHIEPYLPACFLFIFIVVTVIITNYEFIGRDLLWDEAVYYSNANPAKINSHLHPSRSKGIIYMVSILGYFDCSVVSVRFFLLFVSAFLCSFLSFNLAKVIDKKAYFGIAFFSLFWHFQFYSTSIYPNLYVALFFSISLVLNYLYLQNGSKIILYKYLLFTALVFLFRLTDGIVLIGSISLVNVYFLLKSKFTSRSHRNIILFSILAGLLGMSPWIIESFAVYGNPLNRFILSAKDMNSNPTNDIFQHLYLLDGPLSAPDKSKIIPKFGLIWILGLLIYYTLAMLSIRKLRTFLFFIIVPSFFISIKYLFVVNVASTRYFLPLYLMLSISFILYLSLILQEVRKKQSFLSMFKFVTVILYLYISTTFHAKTNSNFHNYLSNSKLGDSEQLIKEVLNGENNSDKKLYVSHNIPALQFYSNKRTFKLTKNLITKLCDKNRSFYALLKKKELKNYDCLEKAETYKIGNTHYLINYN